MTDNATLVFHNTPFLIVGGIVGAFLLLTVAARVREWLRERRERKADTARGEEAEGVTLAPAPRREALELIVKLGAVRGRMLELDRALTQHKEGVPWKFGIGEKADNAFRDADSDIDRFLSERTGRDLNAAQSEMISLFREAVIWLEKYAPEESRRHPCGRES
ncbi:MAG: hypothetical protein IKO14_03440 [Oscillibacter sp.]|nr:hypothetical protein [Oscillibacter sp.]